uniref:TcH SLdT.490 protein n=1 Tax=Toxocara canis TaxID=6265 RepID=P91815_TOXCA|nr:TcH SLdT.490 [Toxocara canis]
MARVAVLFVLFALLMLADAYTCGYEDAAKGNRLWVASSPASCRDARPVHATGVKVKRFVNVSVVEITQLRRGYRQNDDCLELNETII